MKKLKTLFLCVLSVFLLTGCEVFKSDIMEDIDIYTTIYPINYLLDSLYGEYSTIHSIYPNDVNIDEYKLSDKKLNEYAKSDLFVYNSLDKERDYAVKMVNINEDLKIIDVSLGMTYKNSIEELWLNPYNYLMMAQNVRSGLKEYITNPALITHIEENYEQLQYDISNLDAKLKSTINGAKYKTIIVDNDMFKFLEKYNLTVISLEENDKLTQPTIDTAKDLIKKGKVKYIFSANETSNDTVNAIIKETKAELITINSMKSIDGGVTNSNENYLTIMNNNIDAFNKELYK